ncbi:MAG TPA: hypothetical protein VJB16_06335 [archaeon]|nr:hypothetical protein [archaeon]
MHEPTAAEGTAVLAAIQSAEQAANQLLERARASHDQLLARARVAAAQWEQKELETARAEAQAELDAALKASAKAVSRPGGSAEASKLRAAGEKRLPQAVALISESFDRFMDELAAAPAQAADAGSALRQSAKPSDADSGLRRAGTKR